MRVTTLRTPHAGSGLRGRLVKGSAASVWDLERGEGREKEREETQEKGSGGDSLSFYETMSSSSLQPGARLLSGMQKVVKQRGKRGIICQSHFGKGALQVALEATSYLNKG